MFRPANRLSMIQRLSACKKFMMSSIGGRFAVQTRQAPVKSVTIITNELIRLMLSQAVSHASGNDFWKTVFLNFSRNEVSDDTALMADGRAFHVRTTAGIV